MSGKAKMLLSYCASCTYWAKVNKCFWEYQRKHTINKAKPYGGGDGSMPKAPMGIIVHTSRSMVQPEEEVPGDVSDEDTIC